MVRRAPAQRRSAAQAAFDQKKAVELSQKLRNDSFTLDDFLDQMQQVKNMGSMEEILSMLPGMKGKAAGVQVDEKAMARTAAIIQSMTKQERATPDVLNASRRKRIARGSGTSIQEVNRLMNQFDSTRKLMKQMSGGRAKPGRRGFPFGF